MKTLFAQFAQFFIFSIILFFALFTSSANANDLPFGASNEQQHKTMVCYTPQEAGLEIYNGIFYERLSKHLSGEDPFKNLEELKTFYKRAFVSLNNYAYGVFYDRPELQLFLLERIYIMEITYFLIFWESILGDDQ